MTATSQACEHRSPPVLYRWKQRLLSPTLFSTDRQIVVPVSDDLPDGTKVEVKITIQKEKTNMDESDWDDSPEGIDAWIKAVRELEPILSNEVEQGEFDKALQDQKDWEKSQS